MIRKFFFIIILFGLFVFNLFSQDKKIGVLIQKDNTATYDETMEGVTGYLISKNMDNLLVIQNAKEGVISLNSIGNLW